jgi:hypothetical protein
MLILPLLLRKNTATASQTASLLLAACDANADGKPKEKSEHRSPSSQSPPKATFIDTSGSASAAQ